MGPPPIESVRSGAQWQLGRNPQAIWRFVFQPPSHPQPNEAPSKRWKQPAAATITNWLRLHVAEPLTALPYR